MCMCFSLMYYLVITEKTSLVKKQISQNKLAFSLTLISHILGMGPNLNTKTLWKTKQQDKVKQKT